MSGPPHNVVVGRPIDELLPIFIQYKRMSLSNYVTLSDKVSVSQVVKLSLKEYCQARKKYCKYCIIHHPVLSVI